MNGKQIIYDTDIRGGEDGEALILLLCCYAASNVPSPSTPEFCQGFSVNSKASVLQYRVHTAL
jgi:hypothetical protein